MDLYKKQLELQTQSVEVLNDKFEAKNAKKTSKLKDIQLFQTKYLKEISSLIEKERGKDLSTVVAKFYCTDKYKNQIFKIKKQEMKDYRLKAIAQEIVQKMMPLVSQKDITYKKIGTQDEAKELLSFTYDMLFEEIQNFDNIDRKLQSGQLLAFFTFTLSSYEIAWIMFQSIAKLLSTNKDSNTTSTQQIALEIAEDIFGHIAFKLKKEKKQIKQLDNIYMVQIGTELFKFFVDNDVLEEYEDKESKFNTFQFTEEFEEKSSTFYKDLLKYASPFFEPMIVQPLEWTTIDDGGFLKDERSLTKFDLHVMKTQTREDLEHLEHQRNTFSPKLLQAINIIQSTKWKINSPILKVLNEDFKVLAHDNKKEVNSLNKKYKEITNEIKVLKKYNHDMQPKLLSNTYESAKNIRTLKNEMQTLKLTLQVANKYEKYNEIYFVWQIDFRGRIYPVQALLNPQGDDKIKSLLHFAEAKKVDTQALRWFKIHGANCYGKDKISFDDRIQWIDKNQQEILNITQTQHPLESDFLKNASKPYQFLAFAFEYERYIQNPDNFYSSIPIALDGSNNGFQHISVLLRDKDGAKKVNVLPDGTNIPADIYKEVALLTIKELESDIKKFENEKNVKTDKIDPRAFIKKILQFVNRDMVKANVMTDSYGASQDTKAEQIYEYLQNLHELQQINEEEKKVVAKYIAKINTESINKIAPSSKKYKQWMKMLAKKISEQNKPIIWRTPLIGLQVVQENFIAEEHQISTKYNGNNKKIQIRIPTDKIDISKQTSAIAPNFIHSLDATHLYMSVLAGAEKKIKSFALIHDSFGTHAADSDIFIDAIKDAFIELTNSDVLEHFRKEIQKEYNLEIPKAEYFDESKQNKFDIKDIKNSSYFFS